MTITRPPVRSPVVRSLVAASTLALAAAGLQAHEGPETIGHIGHVARAVQAALSNTPIKTGSGQFTYITVPNWAKGPSLDAPTHGSVVIDKAGNIYFSTDKPGQSIMVYTPDGKHLRTIGNELTNIHGMCIVDEGGTEYIYAQSTTGRTGKLSTEGKLVWTIEADQVKKDSGKYLDPAPEAAAAKADGKDKKAKKAAPRSNYRPTAVAVGPSGDIYIADGYGLSWVHQYSRDRKYIRSFGGRGTEPGQFMACHGISLDTRAGKPTLLISDRENKRLQSFDLNGKFIAVVTTDLRRPCAVSIVGDYVAVAELQGRVAILDKNNKLVGVVGDNSDETQWANYRVDPADWKDGIFTAPHSCAFDKDYNLYVMDWNAAGRMTKLNRITK